jgi:hypothetical protein
MEQTPPARRVGLLLMMDHLRQQYLQRQTLA